MTAVDDAAPVTRRQRIRLPAPGTVCACTLLSLVAYTTVSVGVRAWRNHEMIAYIEGRGGSVEMAPIKPEWARNLLVKVAGEPGARAAGEIIGVTLQFSEEGVYRMHEISSLRRLSLEFTPATESSLSHLSILQKIDTLSLAGSALDDDEMQFVSALTQLQTLDLTLTNISDEGLLQLETLAGLRRLHLAHNPRISDGAIEELRALLPECEIDRSTLIPAD